MTYFGTDSTGQHRGGCLGEPPGDLINNTGPYPAPRCFQLSTNEEMIAPAAGGRIDGVSIMAEGTPPNGVGYQCYWALPGLPVSVEAGAFVNTGALLETMADGRVKVAAGGRVVMRALTSGGAGVIIRAAFTTP